MLRLVFLHQLCFYFVNVSFKVSCKDPYKSISELATDYANVGAGSAEWHETAVRCFQTFTPEHRGWIVFRVCRMHFSIRGTYHQWWDVGGVCAA